MCRQNVAFIFALILAASFHPSVVLAADSGPEDLVQQVIAGEFKGDILARRGKVFFPDGKQKIGDCDCSVPREEWQLEEDVVIVDSWKLLGVRQKTTNTVIVDVGFHLIAWGKEVNFYPDGHSPAPFQVISVPQKPIDETVSYKLKNTKDGWRLVDPPRPRVTIQPVRDRAIEQRDIEADLLQKAKAENDLKNISFRDIELHYLNAELLSLDYLEKSLKD
jgi:hypothetical protein